MMSSSLTRGSTRCYQGYSERNFSKRKSKPIVSLQCAHVIA
jgi:hypothetical protein